MKSIHKTHKIRIVGLALAATFAGELVTQAQVQQMAPFSPLAQGTQFGPLPAPVLPAHEPAQSPRSAAAAQTAQRFTVNAVEAKGVNFEPGVNRLQQLADSAYEAFKTDPEGQNAAANPCFASAPEELCGIAIVTIDGQVYTAGDANVGFALEGISKPFTLSLILQQSGYDTLVDKIGARDNGMPFYAVSSAELQVGQVPRGFDPQSLQAVSLVQASSENDRWQKILDFYSKCAGEKLAMNQAIYDGGGDGEEHNYFFAQLLRPPGRLYCEPAEACDVFTKQCSVAVTAKQLAVMGATLANNGVNPVTKERCIDEKYIGNILPVSLNSSMFDNSGSWGRESGLPARSSLGGGVLVVVPGRMAIVGFSPPLGDGSTSVRGSKMASYILDQISVNLLAAAY